MTVTFQPLDMPFMQVKEVGIGLVQRALQQNPSLLTKPTYVCVAPKASDGLVGQRFELLFAPIPDQGYLLDGRMAILPGALSSASPFPYGGSVHGQTIREACLAYAEVNFNGEEGPHKTAFEERLRASIALDRELRPAELGYCGDRSDAREGGSLDPWTTGNVYATQTVGALWNGVQGLRDPAGLLGPQADRVLLRLPGFLFREFALGGLVVIGMRGPVLFEGRARLVIGDALADGDAIAGKGNKAADAGHRVGAVVALAAERILVFLKRPVPRGPVGGLLDVIAQLLLVLRSKLGEVLGQAALVDLRVRLGPFACPLVT
jgi:hypothetical protein